MLAQKKRNCERPHLVIYATAVAQKALVSCSYYLALLLPLLWCYVISPTLDPLGTALIFLVLSISSLRVNLMIRYKQAIAYLMSSLIYISRVSPRRVHIFNLHENLLENWKSKSFKQCVIFSGHAKRSRLRLALGYRCNLIRGLVSFIPAHVYLFKFLIQGASCLCTFP